MTSVAETSPFALIKELIIISRNIIFFIFFSENEHVMRKKSRSKVSEQKEGSEKIMHCKYYFSANFPKIFKIFVARS